MEAWGQLQARPAEESRTGEKRTEQGHSRGALRPVSQRPQPYPPQTPLRWDMEGEVSRGVQAHAGPHAQADLEDSAKPASLAPRPGRTPSRPQCTGPRALPPSSSPERPCRPATLTTLAGLLGVVPGLAAAGASLSAGFWTLPTQGPPHRRDIRAPRPSTPLASLWPKQQCPLPPLPIGRLRHREVTGLALDLHPLSETSLQAIPSGPSWHRPPLQPAGACGRASGMRVPT